MGTDERYLQFPLLMLRELFIDKHKTIEGIIKYGIYTFARKQDCDLYDVARQLMYCYYRKQSDLTNDLTKIISEYIDSDLITLDEEYNGFVGALNEFNPSTAIDQIHPLFETDPDFKEKAIEFYQIRQAYSFLGITGDFYNCIQFGKKIEKTIPVNEPYPSINKSKLFEYRDANKTEFDLMQFAVFIGIRSILGKKPYCRTNKEHILCRAFGYASNKHLPETMNPDIKALFNKYLKRYHIDRILQSLEIDWNIITYSHNIRGLYIGLKNKITLENMILQAETKKKKNQIDALKKQKNEAREKALQQLNKRQQLK